MIVYEFGKENQKTMLMFQCSAEPSWIMFPSAQAMAKDYHVYVAAADGHNPEEDSTFLSVEKYVDDAVSYLKGHHVSELDVVYGISMGGSCVMRLLAIQAIPVKKAIIDAGITPYSYPFIVRKLIAIKDMITVLIGTKNMFLAKIVMPPERWTPEGKNPEEHYQEVFRFLKSKHFTRRTIYNVFWSANNWSCPEPVPQVDTEIEYWYGEEEEKARKNNLAWAMKHFPQIQPRKMKGLAHAELVMVHPSRFYEEATRFLNGNDKKEVESTMNKE